jgi:hypothetical protein
MLCAATNCRFSLFSKTGLDVASLEKELSSSDDPDPKTLSKGMS